MVLNPKVQARAHEELDRVVGQERLPTIEDRSALPYVNAIIKETLRCLNFSISTMQVLNFVADGIRASRQVSI